MRNATAAAVLAAALLTPAPAYTAEPAPPVNLPTKTTPPQEGIRCVEPEELLMDMTMASAQLDNIAARIRMLVNAGRGNRGEGPIDMKQLELWAEYALNENVQLPGNIGNIRNPRLRSSLYVVHRLYAMLLDEADVIKKR